MDEYISRKDAFDILQSRLDSISQMSYLNLDLHELNIMRDAIQNAIDDIGEVPAADVKPVKRGYWKDIMMSEATGWDLSLTGGKDAVCETVCSVCGGGCAFDGDGEALLSQYCPDCGARMDGDTE